MLFADLNFHTKFPHNEKFTCGVKKFSLKLSLKLSLSVKVSMKVSMKISRLLDTTREIRQDDNNNQKVDNGVSKISIFSRAIRYDISISNRKQI